MNAIARYSNVFSDAAKRAFYVTDQKTGMRRRVVPDDAGGWNFYVRPGKAERKRMKRERHAAEGS